MNSPVKPTHDGDLLISARLINKASSVLWLDLDETRHRASVHDKFTHPDRLSASAMGNAQLLPNGHVFVGWGTGATTDRVRPRRQGGSTRACRTSATAATGCWSTEGSTTPSH